MAGGASDAQEELPTRGRGRLIELRKRRRSRSHSVRRAVRSRQLEPAEVDLTLYMSQRKILSLSQENKEKLRNIMRKFHEQKHFSDSSAAFAACDEVVAVTHREEIIRQSRARSDLWPVVYGFANPIPSAEEFVEGIGPYSS